MKSLTLEEGLSELQKLQIILTKGQNSQKIYIFRNLPRLFSENETISSLFPAILDDLLSQSEETQAEAAGGFCEILQRNLLDDVCRGKLATFALNFLKTWSKSLVNAWLQVLVHAIRAEIPENIEKELVFFIVFLAENSQNLTNKCTCAKMLGILAQHKKLAFPRNLLDKALKMCQDPEPQLRKLMAEEVLEQLTGSFQADELEIVLLPKVMELVYDSDLSTKASAISLVFHISPCFSADCVKSRLIPLFLELLSTHNEELAKKVAQLLEKILEKLDFFVKNSLNFQLLATKSLKNFALSKSEEIRVNFFRSLAQIAKTLESRAFLENFKGIYVNSLVSEKNKEIRVVSVEKLAEILQEIGPQSAILHFKHAVLKLLREEDKEILRTLAANLAKIIEKFKASGNYCKEEGEFDVTFEEIRLQSADTFLEIFPELLSLSPRLHEKNLWRSQESLLICLKSPDFSQAAHQLSEKYSNLLEFLLKNGNASIRKAACANLLSLQKTSKSLKKRTEILKMLQNEFLKSRNYHRRMVYLEFCGLAMESFSRKFLCIYIIPDCLELAYDKVANIRRKLAGILPRIRRRIRVNDKENLKLFAEVLGYLKKDFDIDVNEAARFSDSQISSQNFEDFEFLKECENFDAERQKEEDQLSLLELKEHEDSRKRFSEDNDKSLPSKFENSRNNKSVKKSFMIKNYKYAGSPKCSTSKFFNQQPTFASKNAIVLPEKDSKFKIKSRKKSSLSTEEGSFPTKNSAFSDQEVSKQLRAALPLIPLKKSAKRGLEPIKVKKF